MGRSESFFQAHRPHSSNQDTRGGTFSLRPWRAAFSHTAPRWNRLRPLAAEYLGMGKTKLYELTREDEHDVILARPFRMV